MPFWGNLTQEVRIIPDARPFFFREYVWHGTQLYKTLGNTLRFDDISMKWYC